ncbi:MAG: hypothetical protein QW666_01120 [Candidatus Woesearchaeota archaeon]
MDATTTLGKAIYAVEKNEESKNALIYAIDKINSVNSDSIQMIGQLHKKLTGFLDGFSLEDAIVACYGKSKVPREKCREAIQAECLYQISEKREQKYGKIVSKIINKACWLLDKKYADAYARNYMNNKVYEMIKTKSMANKLNLPWWNGMIRLREKQIMEINVQIAQLEKEIEELTKKQQNPAEFDVPEEYVKKYDNTCSNSQEYDKLDKEIEEFYRQLDSEQEE